jgi:ATP-binding cassette subfamily F protein uup
VATVEQEPELDENATVFDVVCNVDGDHEDWQRPSRVRAVLEKLGLPADAQIAGLSGGTRKRVALARALVEEPDLLLLDEPTNHLDFDGIAWLEEMLRTWKGAAVIITHDRRFLDSVATRIVELDRGRLLSFPGNFSQWQERKAQWLESERLEQARFDKLLAQEEVWIRKGVEARRTRNEGRVRRLERLRVERAERRERVGDVSLALAEGQRSGKMVAELEHVGKRFGEKIVVDDYSTTILRGDRIGIIGPNGAGKTTLLKLILGEMQPDSGKTRMGTNVSVAYFDQMRAQLDENATLVDIISPGSEWVEIGGTRKHVMSYLGDFLFSPARAGSPVRSLSGGERARLLLARLFARPANVLVLDEPTNDLDIETLELLEELLQEYSGTVLLVSHDRAFLNNVVTQTIAYEGNGHWRDYVGGYDEWVAQRPAPAPAAAAEEDAAKAARAADEAAARAKAAKPKPARAAKMNSWELRELEGLPEAIAALEAQQAELAGKLADGSLYRDAPAEVERINSELSKLESELEEKFARWELLEARRESAL